MKTIKIAASVIAGMVLGIQAEAATVLEVDYSFLTPGQTFGDGEKVEDISGNGYHGFWGNAVGSYSAVATPTGTGIDTTTETQGYTFHRDGLTGIPGAWDGPTTTVTPYFTLGAGTSYTFEAVVNWNNTASTLNGLMGQTGGNEFWWRENGGNMQYQFSSGSSVNEFGSNIDVSAAKADGNWHHLALVLDQAAGEVRSYLDYELLYTDPFTIGSLGAMLNGTSDFRTSAYNTTTSNVFNGIQDHFRISDSALLLKEFIGGPQVPEPGSLALLLMGGLMCTVLRKQRG